MLGGKVARVRRELDELTAHLRVTGDDGRRLADDPLVRERIGALASDLEAARMLAVRCVEMIERGEVPHHEAAMAKVFCGELEERLGETALELLGPAAALSRGAPGAELDGLFEHIVRASLLDVIGGGTNDIQRTLIAVRGLRLPR
jgi:alkylation response protein AidB-like acyl-CoA dehydrogenase